MYIFKKFLSIFIVLFFVSNALIANEYRSKKKTCLFFKKIKSQKIDREKIAKIKEQRKEKKKFLQKGKSNQETVSENIEYNAMALDEIDQKYRVITSSYGAQIISTLKELVNVLEKVNIENMKDVDLSRLKGVKGELEKEVFECYKKAFEYYKEETIDSEGRELDKEAFFNMTREVLSFASCLNKKDWENAEKLAVRLNSNWGIIEPLHYILSGYVWENNLGKAQSLYEKVYDKVMVNFNIYVIMGFLKNKQLDLAEKLAFSEKNQYIRSEMFYDIFTYYILNNDEINAKRVINEINCCSTMKEMANFLLLDLYAKQNNLIEFQKIAMFSNSEDFRRTALFILKVNQENFDLIETSLLPDWESSYSLLNYYVERFCITNQMEKAKKMLNFYYYIANEQDEETYDSWYEDYEDDAIFLILNTCLKKGNIEEAKEISKKINDNFEKWFAYKLIASYEEKLDLSKGCSN